MRQRLIRNITSNYLGFAVNTLVVLLLTPFLIRRLGDSVFGIWVLLNAFLSYFQMMEFGVMPSLIRFVSFHRAREEQRQIESVIGSAGLLLAGLGLAALPVVYLIGTWASRWFDLSAVDSEVFVQAVWVMGAAVVLTFFKRLFFAVIQGYQRFDLLNISAASGSIFGAAATVYFVAQGGGILALMIILAAQTVYEILFEAGVLLKVFHLRPRFSDLSTRNFKKIFGYSYYAYLIDIAVTVAYKIDMVVIGLFLPAASITYYAIATRAARVLEKAVEPLEDTFFPLASELHTAGGGEALKKLLLRGTQASVLLVTPGVLLIYLHGADLIGWWVGAAYREPSLPVLHIFLAVIFLSVFEATAASIFLGSGKVRFVANVYLLSAAANLLLSLLLVKDYGIAGVAMGTLIPAFVSIVLVTVPYACRMTRTSLREFYGAVFTPALAVFLPSWIFIEWTRGLSAGPVAVFAVNVAFVAAVTALAFFKWIKVR